VVILDLVDKAITVYSQTDFHKMALIHGHGGKFLLHGGKLETMTGDADTNRPAAGISTCYQQRFLENKLFKLDYKNALRIWTRVALLPLKR